MDVGDYLDMKSWALRLGEKKDKPESGMGKNTTKPPTIFKVPPKLSHVRDSAFLPECFSFGPYHYKDPSYDESLSHLRDSSSYDELKKRYSSSPFIHLKSKDVEDISFGKWRLHDRKRRQLPLHFSEDNVGDTKAILTGEVVQYPSRDPCDDVLKQMIDLVQEARECYDESHCSPSINCFSDFFKMMIVDGSFIIQMLRFHNEKKRPDLYSGSGDSTISETPWVLPSFQRDLIKLANQIPFFLLIKLFSLTATGNETPSLQNLCVTLFCSMLSLDRSIYMLDCIPTRNYAFPLDLFRSLFVFSMIKKPEGNEEVHKIHVDDPKLTYSAQDLQQAGIKIIRKDNSSLLDISYDAEERTLRIPPLSIDENMIVALLNFVAYEQCDQSKRPYFINYLLFLDSLINATEDLHILYKNRIIKYPLGTEKEVVKFFNDFGKGMLYAFNQTYFFVDMEKINKHCADFQNNQWSFWWANLKKDRFSNPWTFLSLVAATALLILTMLQTFFTVFPYYHPN